MCGSIARTLGTHAPARARAHTQDKILQHYGCSNFVLCSELCVIRNKDISHIKSI